jgi:hypothetical protein
VYGGHPGAAGAAPEPAASRWPGWPVPDRVPPAGLYGAPVSNEMPLAGGELPALKRPAVDEVLAAALTGQGAPGVRALGLLRDARRVLTGAWLERPAKVAESCLRGAADVLCSSKAAYSGTRRAALWAGARTKRAHQRVRGGRPLHSASVPAASVRPACSPPRSRSRAAVPAPPRPSPPPPPRRLSSASAVARARPPWCHPRPLPAVPLSYRARSRGMVIMRWCWGGNSVVWCRARCRVRLRARCRVRCDVRFPARLRAWWRVRCRRCQGGWCGG